MCVPLIWYLTFDRLPSNDDPMAGNTNSMFSPAPFTPLFTTRGQPHAGTTVTFPTCLVPQDIIDAGRRWNINWNARPEGSEVFGQQANETGHQGGDTQGVSFPVSSAESERRESTGSTDGPRQSGHRFYSDVSEKHRQDVGTLSQTAISPMQWLGGLRCLKVQGKSAGPRMRYRLYGLTFSARLVPQADSPSRSRTRVWGWSSPTIRSLSRPGSGRTGSRPWSGASKVSHDVLLVTAEENTNDRLPQALTLRPRR